MVIYRAICINRYRGAARCDCLGYGQGIVFNVEIIRQHVNVLNRRSLFSRQSIIGRIIIHRIGRIIIHRIGRIIVHRACAALIDRLNRDRQRRRAGAAKTIVDGICDRIDT